MVAFYFKCIDATVIFSPVFSDELPLLLLSYNKDSFFLFFFFFENALYFDFHSMLIKLHA